MINLHNRNAKLHGANDGASTTHEEADEAGCDRLEQRFRSSILANLKPDHAKLGTTAWLNAIAIRDKQFDLNVRTDPTS